MLHLIRKPRFALEASTIPMPRRPELSALVDRVEARMPAIPSLPSLVVEDQICAPRNPLHTSNQG
jgi:hypothetical protein